MLTLSTESGNKRRDRTGWACRSPYPIRVCVYERNVRYEDAENNLTHSHRVLRLRQDTRTRLTYKEPVKQAFEGVQARVELEVTVSDFEMMDTILGKLGFMSAWTYEKYRTTYTLFGAEVTLDEMPYGNFTEVEGPRDAIERVLAVLFTGEFTRIQASYSDIFFRVKQRMHLTMNDLTFDNFKGITVPDSAFL